MEQRERMIEYVTKAQNGDKQALGMLFGECYDALYYFALKSAGDSELAMDITQNACVEIQETLGNLKEPAAFMSWAKKITYHQYTKLCRKKQDVLVTENEEGFTVFDTLEEDNADFIPEEALNKKDFQLTVMRIVDSLPEVQRTAVMMFYFDEMSIREIAEVQGVSENTVKSRLKYGRDAIKAAVEEYEKKHQVKLHSFGFAPFLLWLFRTDKTATALSPEAASAVAQGISSATGTAVGASASGTAVGASASAGVAAGGAAIGAKIAAGVAVLAGVAVAITGGIMAFSSPSDKDNTDPASVNTPTTAVVETVPNTIDLFEAVTVTFDGMDGEGAATLDGTCDEADVTFTLDREHGLTNGQVVTVTADISDEEMLAIEQRGLTVEATEKKFVVEGLGVFMNDLSQLSQQTIDQITAAFLQNRHAEFEDRDDVTITDVRYLGAQLRGPFHFALNNRENTLYLMYEVTAEKEGYGEIRYYSYAAERDVIFYGENELTMSPEQFGEPQHYGIVFDDVSGDGFRKDGVIFSGFETYDGMLKTCLGEIVASDVSGQGEFMSGLAQLSQSETDVLTDMFETRCRDRYAQRDMTVQRVTCLGSYFVDATADDNYEPGDAIDAVMLGYWFDFESTNALVNVYEVDVTAPDGGVMQTYQLSYKQDVLVYADGKTSMRQNDMTETYANGITSFWGIDGTGFVQDDVLYDGYADAESALAVLMQEIERYDMPYETTGI